MVSEQERDRRYAAIRAAMSEEGLEALVVCSRSDLSERGHIRYVSNFNMMGGITYVLLPLRDDPILFQPSYIGKAWAEAAGWVKDNRSAIDPAQGVAEALLDMDLGRSTIGVVGLKSVMPIHDLQVLEKALPEASLQDATQLLDMVRLIKSEEEIGYLRDTSAILRSAYEVIENSMMPGMTEREVTAEAKHIIELMGGQNGFAHISRSQGLTMLHPPTDDVLQPGEVVTFDLEYAGPQGYCLELSRHYSFGEPPDAVLRVFNVQIEVFQRCLEMMKPGAPSNAILEVARATYARHGFEAAGPVGHGPVQFHAHGIGLGFGEPPYVPGHALTLEAGMVVCLHPHIGPEDPLRPVLSIEDSVLITPNGPERLTYPHNEWTVL